MAESFLRSRPSDAGNGICVDDRGFNAAAALIALPAPGSPRGGRAAGGGHLGYWDIGILGYWDTDPSGHHHPEPPRQQERAVPRWDATNCFFIIYYSELCKQNPGPL